MSYKAKTSSLLNDLRQGSRRALAGFLTLVENGAVQDAEVWHEILTHQGSTQVIGITGAPGSGKSSLTNHLIKELRQKRLSVGVIAVDPSSPFTHGAILGDRIRMLEHSSDEAVYIRSMANRGHLGGLAPTTSRTVWVMKAFGFDCVIIETVGVGQAEVDIIKVADTVCLVMSPGTGDDIQGLKAGITEIADVIVVNKSDLQGADTLKKSLEAAFSLNEAQSPPPVFLTNGISGEGIDTLSKYLTDCKRKPNNDKRELRLRAELKLELDGAVQRALEEAEDTIPWQALHAGKKTVIQVATNLAQTLDLAGQFENQPAILGIDHLGVAVSDMEQAKAVFVDLLKLPAIHEEYVEKDKVHTLTLQLDHVNIELLAATEGPVAKYLEKKGPGIHHICFRVKKIQVLLDTMKERGLRLIDDTPRKGAHGRMVAFLHPKSTAGILCELAEVDV